MFRRVAERLSRGRAYWRALPAEFRGARVLVSPDAALRYLKPGCAVFDGGLLDLARRFVQPGDTVWDVGGNVGVFSVAAATRAGSAGRVVCFEPDPWLAGLLRRTAGALPTGCARIEVVGCALADEQSVRTLCIAERGRASNALEAAHGRTQAGGVRERVSVPVLTADGLIESAGRPEFVKIDVEGAELMVLHGASRLLGEVRPAVYCEVAGELAGEVGALLRDAGYLLFDFERDAQCMQPLEVCAFDTLALPRERRG